MKVKKLFAVGSLGICLIYFMFVFAETLTRMYWSVFIAAFYMVNYLVFCKLYWKKITSKLPWAIE